MANSPTLSVIYGVQGVGKTAMLKYLYDKIRKETNQVLLIDAAKFSSKYAYAAQSGYLTAFRNDIRSYKLILVDNIDSLKSKKKSIEELFHTLETITTQGGKAVISYKGSSLSFEYLGERFASRLRAALAIPITEPSLSEKQDFITYYLNSKPIHKTLMDNTLTVNDLRDNRLAQAIRDSRNFCELIDSVHNVLSILKPTLSDDIKEESSAQADGLFYQLPTQRRDIHEMTAHIIPIVCHYFGVAETLVRGGAKRKSAVEARYMVYLLLNELCGYSYTEIAKAYGKNTRLLLNHCIVLKATRQEGFETLCQKLYNQLKTCKNSKEI